MRCGLAGKQQHHVHALRSVLTALWGRLCRSCTLIVYYITMQVIGTKGLLGGIKTNLESPGPVRQFAASQGVPYEDIWLLAGAGKSSLDNGFHLTSCGTITWKCMLDMQPADTLYQMVANK